MKIHYLQHVPFETPANIFSWAKKRNVNITGSHLYKNEPFPDFSSFDTLLVMGGPMGVYDEKKYPFLKREKIFIENAIKLNKRVIGICLGSQLIADVLGSKIYKCDNKEIGWYPIFKTDLADNSKYFYDFPEKLEVFHWHGDTFDIPKGMKHTFYSEGCPNQSFEDENGQIIALQFHFEVNINSVKDLIDNSKDELKKKGRFIQTEEEMLSDYKRFIYLEDYLYKFMDKLLFYKTGGN